MLLLVAYSVRDILWLRWFAVAAAATNIPYFVLQRHVLRPPIFWGSVIMAINLYQIARIYLERRPIRLSEDEQKLYDMAFGSFVLASSSHFCSQVNGRLQLPATRYWKKESRFLRLTSSFQAACSREKTVRI